MERENGAGEGNKSEAELNLERSSGGRFVRRCGPAEERSGGVRRRRLRCWGGVVLWCGGKIQTRRGGRMLRCKGAKTYRGE